MSPYGVKDFAQYFSGNGWTIQCKLVIILGLEFPSQKILWSSYSIMEILYLKNTSIILWAYHYSNVIMDVMTSQVTGVRMVCSNVCSGANQRKHQSSGSLAFVRGIPRRSVNSPHSNAKNVSIWWRHHDILFTDQYPKEPAYYTLHHQLAHDGEARS